MTKLEGGCQCGAVRYEITEDLMGVGVCHCRACQYASGGGPNYVALAPKSGFRITKGEPKRFVRAGGSGADVARVFCAECGTPLWSEAALPFLPVKAGSLDDNSTLEPAVHLWTSAAPPWHPIDPARPAFPENPPR
ncbi:hypothetical protein PMI01_01448 [Caulobacter sp. AP07]|uniref:GFA family protein n=1 Tax=Caulobacter sp. AP07 TaxID=1144304 RepID=UPI0002720BC9|nr:GFA family protein [Caulobacter sp. AP07]EJL34755.1 hypothetical protein PMI01_01448 [Caulobacter sp. AP07]